VFEPVASAQSSLGKSYATAAAIIGTALAWMGFVTSVAPRAVESEALVPPMCALFLLTVAVWLSMLVVRNVGFVRGTMSEAYLRDYRSNPPVERLERPARTFNNLMQVPTLFYVVCLLMIVLQRADQAQLALAWTFVALRTLHAAVYIGLNFLPYRFALWVSSYLALCLLWGRLWLHL
jgi:hypothetical protein